MVVVNRWCHTLDRHLPLYGGGWEGVLLAQTKKGPRRYRGPKKIQKTQNYAALRSTIIFLICAMALAGLRPLGQTLVQFMMVWQR